MNWGVGLVLGELLAPELALAVRWLEVHAPDADRVIARLDAASL